MSKKIYKNQWVGQPQSELISNNKIQGAFGIMANNIMSEEKALWQGNIPLFNNDVSATSTYGFYQGDDRSEYRYDTNWQIPVNLDIDFLRPTYVSQIRFEILWSMTKWIFMKDASTISDFNNLKNIMRGLPLDRRNIAAPQGFTTLYFQNYEGGSEISDPKPHSNPNRFKLTYSTTLISTKQSRCLAERSHLGDNPLYLLSFDTSTLQGQINFASYFPTNIIVTVVGTEILTTDVAFQIGSQENAYEIKKNPLITTRATKGGVPLHQFLTNEIINEWHDGKQTVGLTKIVNGPQDLSKIDDSAIVVNARESDVTDINRQSIARNKDGTAKEFEVSSAEFRFDGSYKQIIDMAEKKKGN